MVSQHWKLRSIFMLYLIHCYSWIFSTAKLDMKSSVCTQHLTEPLDLMLVLRVTISTYARDPFSAFGFSVLMFRLVYFLLDLHGDVFSVFALFFSSCRHISPQRTRRKPRLCLLAECEIVWPSKCLVMLSALQCTFYFVLLEPTVQQVQ